VRSHHTRSQEEELVPGRAGAGCSRTCNCCHALGAVTECSTYNPAGDVC
jgi:hypothetical protein